MLSSFTTNGAAFVLFGLLPVGRRDGREGEPAGPVPFDEHHGVLQVHGPDVDHPVREGRGGEGDAELGEA